MPENSTPMYGWVFEPEYSLDNLDNYQKRLAPIKAKKFTHVVLCGMGGSSLCSLVFSRIFKAYNFYVLDTIHPEDINKLENDIDITSTLFIIASKSGDTMEPNLLFEHFLTRLKDQKVSDPLSHFMAITDPVTPLEQLAAESGFLECFAGKHDIGGRFSALSVFGVIPLLLMDINPHKLLVKACETMQDVSPGVFASDNPAVLLGCFLATIMTEKYEALQIRLSPALKPLGMWLEQLLAESLGKKGTGVLPLIKDTFILNKNHAYCHIALEEEEHGLEHKEAIDAVYLTLPSKDCLLAHMYLWEMAVALAGVLQNINPFNQPDVEKSKKLAAKALENNTKLPKCSLEQLQEFLQTLSPNEYLAILAFVPENHETHTLLNNFQKLFTQKGYTVMVQWGPRYLHSTGQFFKGGPKKGSFLFLTDSYKTSLGALASHHQSQITGDFETLTSLNKKAIVASLEDLSSKLAAVINNRF